MDAQSDTNSDIRVPDLRTRTVTPFEVIQRLVNRIAERYQLQHIILFGAYAYGTPHPESDVDLLVIMDTPLREIQ
jgi:predicted nucleotidyltransferase